MHYTAYGLQIASELCLPELLPSAAMHPDVRVRRGSVPPALDEPLWRSVICEARPGQLLLRLDGIANYLISDGNTITVEPAPMGREEDVRLFLLGSCFGALLHQRGVLPLHGSAIRTRDGAVVFLGHSGAGKSTVAAAFYERGYRVLTDDVCVVSVDRGRPVVHPAFPRVHLWPDVLERLRRPLPRLIVRAKLEKVGVPLDARFAVQPVPLHAAYELNIANTSRVTIEPLAEKERFEAIVTHTYRRQFLNGLGLRRPHFARAVSVARPISVSRVNRPQQPFLLAELVQALEQDLGRFGVDTSGDWVEPDRVVSGTADLIERCDSRHGHRRGSSDG